MTTSTTPTDNARSQLDRAVEAVQDAQARLDALPPLENIDRNEHRTLSERAQAVQDLADVQAILDEFPTVEAIAARDLLERRDAAYYQAMGEYIAQARRDAEAVQARVQEQFDMAVVSEKLSMGAVLETLLALLDADDDRIAAFAVGNFRENSVLAPALIPALRYSELVDQVVASRRARRGESARNALNAEMNTAGVAASTKVK